jgi:hypothetical protein
VIDLYADLAERHKAVLNERHANLLPVVLRSVRVKLLDGYVKQTLRKLYYEAIKV